MQRSTKVDEWSYTEDLTQTDYYPNPAKDMLILAVTALGLLAGISAIKSPSSFSDEVSNYFRMKMMGLL